MDAPARYEVLVGRAKCVTERSAQLSIRDPSSLPPSSTRTRAY